MLCQSADAASLLSTKIVARITFHDSTERQNSLGGALVVLVALFMNHEAPSPRDDIRGVTFETHQDDHTAWETFLDSRITHFMTPGGIFGVMDQRADDGAASEHSDLMMPTVLEVLPPRTIPRRLLQRVTSTPWILMNLRLHSPLPNLRRSASITCVP
ncbi:hypothetical protein BJV77DRAFT_1022020 [Russula vinacea]|nr:hypothetical protein BJV77DRAFT_1022020 [Russula vinacea]